MDDKLRKLERNWKSSSSYVDAEAYLSERLRSEGLDARLLLERLWYLEKAVVSLRDYATDSARGLRAKVKASDLLGMLDGKGPLESSSYRRIDADQELAREEEDAYNQFIEFAEAHGLDLSDYDREEAVGTVLENGVSWAVLHVGITRVSTEARRGLEMALLRGFKDLQYRFREISHTANNSEEQLLLARGGPQGVVLEQALSNLGLQRRALRAAQRDLVREEERYADQRLDQ